MGCNGSLAMAAMGMMLLWVAGMCTMGEGKDTILRNEVTLASKPFQVDARRLQPANYEPKVFEFYTNSLWNLYQREFKPWHVDFTKVTHLVYGFFDVTDTCEVGVINGGYLDFMYKFPEMGMGRTDYDGPLGAVGAFKMLQDWAEDAGLNRFKLIMSLGGWNHSRNFSNCASTEANRSTLAGSILAFGREHEFDGVNINWQWPGPHGINSEGSDDDIDNYVALVTALQDELPDDIEVSINQGMAPDVIMELGDDDRLCNMVDYTLLHTYDYNGYWNDQTGFNAPIVAPAEGDPRYCIQWGLGELVRIGCNINKLVLGIPGYGTCWSGVDGGDNGDGLWQHGPAGCQGTNEHGKVKYYEMYTEGYPEDYQVRNENSENYITPYWFHDGVFVSFDNQYSVAMKSYLASESNMAGILLFEAVDDKELQPTEVDLGHGLGPVKTYELLSASVRGWSGPPTTTTPSPSTTRPTTSSTERPSTTTGDSPSSTTADAPSTTTVGPSTTTGDGRSSTTGDGETTTSTCPPDGSSTPWYNMERYMNRFINLYLDRFQMTEYLDMYIDRFINRYISSPRRSSTTTASP